MWILCCSAASIVNGFCDRCSGDEKGLFGRFLETLVIPRSRDAGNSGPSDFLGVLVIRELIRDLFEGAARAL